LPLKRIFGITGFELGSGGTARKMRGEQSRFRRKREFLR